MYIYIYIYIYNIFTYMWIHTYDVLCHGTYVHIILRLETCIFLAGKRPPRSVLKVMFAQTKCLSSLLLYVIGEHSCKFMYVCIRVFMCVYI